MSSEIEPLEPGTRRRAGAATAAAVLLFLASQQIPLPGLDRAALEATLHRHAPHLVAWWLSATGGMLLPLVAIRGLAALFDSAPSVRPQRVTRAALALYILLGVARGLWIAAGEASLASASGPPIRGMAPGPIFAVLLALTCGAGAAIDWLLSDFISRQGLARGPLALLGASLVLESSRHLAAFGRSAGREGISSVHSLIALGAALPAGMVMLALSRKSAIAWPIRLKRGLVLGSELDVLVMPYLAGSIALQLALVLSSIMLDQGAARLPWLDEIDTLAAIATAASIALFLLARPAKGFDPRRLALGAIAPFLVFLPAFGALALDAEASLVTFFGGHRGFEGDARFELLLSAEGGDGSRDAAIFVERLTALGVKSELVETSAGRIRLRLQARVDVDRVLKKLLVRGRLTLAPVREEKLPDVSLSTDGALSGLTLRLEKDAARYVARSRAAFDPLIREASTQDSVVAVDCRPSIERAEAERCSAFVLAPPTPMTDRDLRSARVIRDRVRSPRVELELTHEATARARELARTLVGRGVVLAMDDAVLLGPMPAAQLESGRLTVVPTGKNVEEQLEDARALSAVLCARALSREWSIASFGRIKEGAG